MVETVRSFAFIYTFYRVELSPRSGGFNFLIFFFSFRRVGSEHSFMLSVGAAGALCRVFTFDPLFSHLF